MKMIMVEGRFLFIIFFFLGGGAELLLARKNLQEFEFAANVKNCINARFCIV